MDGAAYLSVLDISNSFYQVPILEEDRQNCDRDEAWSA